MDHNLINWNNKGPITALKALEIATSTWDNSLKLDYTYDTSLAPNNYVTLSWLVENTTGYTNSGATANTYGANNYGYWTLSPHASRSYHMWGVDTIGNLVINNVINDDAYGVRPVITISKSVLQ